MPEVIVKFKRTKVIKITFERELTEQEIDDLESGNFNPDDYDYGNKKSFDVKHNEYDNYDTEFDQMEFGDDETYDVIYNTSDLDDYKDYLKSEEERKEEEAILEKYPDYIKPHGKSIF